MENVDTGKGINGMLRYFSVDRSLMKDSAMDSLGDESIISLRIRRKLPGNYICFTLYIAVLRSSSAVSEDQPFFLSAPPPHPHPLIKEWLEVDGFK
ncbi:hypothetical protein CDAR_306001 [Caerostris darwini]|uniref:Uncharacterized protein n=1 Tax=Caerostris darwini TaxID=1538125 RepID=A0AAV4VRN9_9ARAC|nr:hypothetical protein CDAR_306001 [Caerostris darwini]